jgi:hypothetical protein
MREDLQRGELGMDAELHGVRIVVRVRELVGGVDLGFELDGLDRRALQAQSLRAVLLVARERLRRQAAGQRIGVVLQRDHPLDGRGGDIGHDDARLEQLRGVGERAHGLLALVALVEFGAAG